MWQSGERHALPVPSEVAQSAQLGHTQRTWLSSLGNLGVTAKSWLLVAVVAGARCWWLLVAENGRGCMCNFTVKYLQLLYSDFLPISCYYLSFFSISRLASMSNSCFWPPKSEAPFPLSLSPSTVKV